MVAVMTPRSGRIPSRPQAPTNPPGVLEVSWRVRDAMTKRVYRTRPDESLWDAARTMREKHVSGLPVVNARDAVVGVLSERDVVRALDTATSVQSARGILDLLMAAASPSGSDRIRQYIGRLRRARVSEFMNPDPILIEPDQPLAEAGRRMRLFGVNRLPVVAKRRLVGIVSRQDFLAAFDRVSAEPNDDRGETDVAGEQPETLDE